MKVNKRGDIWRSCMRINGFQRKWRECFREILNEGEGNITPVKMKIYREKLKYSDEMIDLLNRMTQECYDFFLSEKGRCISEIEKEYNTFCGKKEEKKESPKLQRPRWVLELSTCHYCKQKRYNEKYHCDKCHANQNGNKSSKTRGNFCHKCLRNHFPREKHRLDNSTVEQYFWVCPQCRESCDCKRCKQARLLKNNNINNTNKDNSNKKENEKPNS